MGKLFVYFLYLLIVSGIVFFVFKYSTYFFRTRNRDQSDEKYEIGSRGDVNDLYEHGNKTIQVKEIGDGFLVYVLKPDEFWYVIERSDRDQAAVFYDKEKAIRVAAQLLASEGYPVRMERGEIDTPLSSETTT